MDASSPYTLLAQRKRPINEAPCSPAHGLASFADQEEKAREATRQDRIKTLELLLGRSLSTYEGVLCWWYGIDYVEEQIQQAEHRNTPHGPS